MSEIFTISPFPGREACDFCSERPTIQIYPCKNFVVPRFKTSVFQHESIGGWAACSKCSDLIDAGRWAELTDRAFTNFLKQHWCPATRTSTCARSSAKSITCSGKTWSRRAEMQIRNNWGELIREINTAQTSAGEVITTNTMYDRGNPVFQTISVRDNQGQIRTTNVIRGKILP